MKHDELGCTICLRNFPGKKYWQQSKIKIEVFGSSIEASICPECQKAIVGDPANYSIPGKFMNEHWKALRESFQKARFKC